MTNTKVGDNGEFTPGYPVCQGCENLTIGKGWFCAYKPGTMECEYPENMPRPPLIPPLDTAMNMVRQHDVELADKATAEIDRLRAAEKLEYHWSSYAQEILEELRKDYSPGGLSERDGITAVKKLRATVTALTDSVLALRTELLAVKGMWKETIDTNTRLLERDNLQILLIAKLRADVDEATTIIKYADECNKTPKVHRNDNGTVRAWSSTQVQHPTPRRGDDDQG